LALSVALSHFGGPVALFNSRYAVQCFYIISGYLIAMILAEKYSGQYRLFYTNRAARIYVPYWFALLLTVTVCWAGNRGTVVELLQLWSNFDIVTCCYVISTNVLIFGQDWGLFLGWSADEQLYWTSKFYESKVAVWRFQAIPQAWTVSVELWFYLLAPLILRSNTATLVVLACCTFMMQIFANVAGLDRDPWNYRFFPFELTWFILGALAYRFGNWGIVKNALDRSPMLLPLILFIGAVALLLGWGRLSWIGALSWRASAINQPIGLFLLTALALPALFRFSSRNRWDRRVGDLSYPIYILHYTVIWVLGTWNLWPSLGYWRHVGLTLALSVLVAVAIEAPLDRWRQRRVAQLIDVPRR